MRGCRSTTCIGRRRWWWRSPPARRARAWKVGLADGRILPLSIDNAAAQRKLALHDVIFVRVTEGGSKSKGGARAELRVRPVVQGSVVVLENKTGRILAMAGGFLVPAEPAQPRRPSPCASRARAIKPLSYLAALGRGPAAQYADHRRADHAAADRRRPRAGSRTIGRRRITMAAAAVRSRCAVRSRIRAISRPCDLLDERHRGQAGSEPRPALRTRLEAQIYTRMQRATIRSCSARNRCGRSISRRSTRRSPMKALRPSPHVDRYDRAQRSRRLSPAIRNRRHGSASVDRAAFYPAQDA